MTTVAQEEARKPPRPRFLVVDDELGYREGIKRVLANRGHHAETASSGAEGIELALQGDQPIVLVDLKMPGIDGFGVIEQLRQQRPGTLIIVVSAFATIESAVQTTKMGAFDFVAKPFLPDDLLLVVDRAVETWQLAREAELLRREREANLLELAAEKSRLRTIIQSIAEGLLVVNVEGDVVLDNPMTRRLLGRVHQARISGPVAIFIDNDQFLDEIGRMLAGQGPDGGTILELPLRADNDSAERFLRANLAPVRDERGAVLGVVVLLADITDVKAFERMKNLFVSMVAHELKAPIGAVEGYLHLLGSGGLDVDPVRRSEVINRCLARTGALLELINDLTEITRRDVGRHVRRLEQLDLGALCRNLLEFHRQGAKEHDLHIELVVDDGVPTLLADRGDIERVLTNFLSNAIKYNRNGGRITVHLGTQGSLVYIEVSDTGIGMTTDEVRRLGEDFFRAKNEHTRTVTGTGLGIALVKKIVDSYHGALEVESEPEQGSTFRVLLPAGAESATPPKGEQDGTTY